VLEGSVQRAADRIRITAQLIDALTGDHIWAERYDRDLKDIFALQDEITMKVLESTKVKLTDGQVTPISKYYTGKQGLDCYLKTQEALGYQQRRTVEDTHLARQILEEVIAMCPEAPRAYTTLAWTHINDYILGSTKSPSESINKAIELGQKSVAIDDSNAENHVYLGVFYIFKREYDKALAEGERALALNPSGAWVNYNYALILTWAGRPEEAIPLAQKAIRLNPLGPVNWFNGLGHALQVAGRLEEAVVVYKKGLQRGPYFQSRLMLAATYSMMGREKEARAEAAEALRINPKYSLDYFAKTFPFKDQSDRKSVV
jgi:adenylate cyclase